MSNEDNRQMTVIAAEIERLTNERDNLRCIIAADQDEAEKIFLFEVKRDHTITVLESLIEKERDDLIKSHYDSSIEAICDQWGCAENEISESDKEECKRVSISYFNETFKPH